MIDLKNKPFYLSDMQEDWVRDTLASMSEEEKIGQIFCPIVQETDKVELLQFIKMYKPGAMMFRPMSKEVVRQAVKDLQEGSKIPLLIAANLESGGNGICMEGTYYSRPMGVAATSKAENAYNLGAISGKEAKAVGCNWGFSPICDIDMNFHNPITNVRTYGSDKDKIIDFVSEQMRGMAEYGIASCPKHFPGDGVDSRDQHLLSTVNSLSVDEWDDSYGKVWKSVIDNGALSIMAGHILQPAYSKHFNYKLKDEEILPATLSQELLRDLLRDKLKFNGVIITDATPMVGFNVAMPRKKAIPYSIAAGCDMILFNKSIDEDYQAIRDGLDEGTLTRERLDQAVTRILAMKAGMKLPEKRASGSLVPEKLELENVGCVKHEYLAKECADLAVTLVKDTQKILPISPNKYKKVRLYILNDKDNGGFKDGGGAENLFAEKLENEGFEVTVYDYNNLDFHEIFREGTSELSHKFDLAIYIANMDTASNQSVRRLDWIHLMAADAPWFVKEIPTMFISISNPYHLEDVPMIKTFINAYTPTETVVDAVIEKIMGRGKFSGASPVDPFCGIWGTEF